MPSEKPSPNTLAALALKARAAVDAEVIPSS